MLPGAVARLSAAGRFEFEFRNVPLPEALQRVAGVDKANSVNFIYNDIENYRVTANVSTSDFRQAVRQVCARKPLSVIFKGRKAYIEAKQKGVWLISGSIAGPQKEGIPFATVMVLEPNDSSVITFGVADAEGRFRIPCDRRITLLKLSSVGYRTKYVTLSDSNAGTITMELMPVRLKNVAVEAKRAFIDEDKTVYLPTRREKNAAHGGADLLLAMAIPTIVVDPATKSVTTNAGEGVSLFIDYVAADAGEVAALRPQDVRKVEVYDYPADIRFGGARHVVNYIMVKYEYGGYTKAGADQRIVNLEGDYKVNSKFTWRRMTYDLGMGFNYSSTDHGGLKSDSRYILQGDTVCRHQYTVGSHSASHSGFVTLRTQYSDSLRLISNTVGLNLSRTPGNSLSQQTDYSALYPSEITQLHTSASNINSNYKGTFNFYLPRSLALMFRPEAVYGYNKSNSRFQSEVIPLVNDVVEKAWMAIIPVTLQKKWGRQSLSVSLTGEFNGNRLAYSGSNPAIIKYSQRAVGVRLDASLSFGKFWLRPSVKCFFDRTGFAGVNYTQWLPSYFISAGMRLNSRLGFYVSSELSNWTIPVSSLSPNIVMRNVIEAVKGNSSLKAYMYNSVRAEMQYFPSSALSMSFWGKYEHFDRPMTFDFTPVQIDGRQMMLRSYVREGSYSNVDYGLACTLRLFGNSLSLTGRVRATHAHRGGQRRLTGNFIAATLSAYYYLRDFYFSAYYTTPARSMGIDDDWLKRPGYCQFTAGWSHRNLNISISACNPFRSDWTIMESSMAFPLFSETSTAYGGSWHRSFLISVTYSIPYGKKMDRRDEVGPGASVQSGIVN